MFLSFLFWNVHSLNLHCLEAPLEVDLFFIIFFFFSFYFSFLICKLMHKARGNVENYLSFLSDKFICMLFNAGNIRGRVD